MSHKGIVCPKCGAGSGEPHPRYGIPFTYVTNVVTTRIVKGFTPDGRLKVEGGYYELMDDTNDRLSCDACSHQFAIPQDVLDAIEWLE